MKASVIIPTLNADAEIGRLIELIETDLSGTEHEIIVVDSASDDDTVKIASEAGATVFSIRREEFDHGATRQYAAEKAKAEILVYLTQDAVPLEGAISNLIRVFDNPEMGIAYGRQLPAPDATPFARHLREFNYPPESSVKSYQDKTRFGMKVAFNSDSFSAYRKIDLTAIGGFPRTMMAEDVYVGAKMILSGKQIAYAAESAVIHSHNLPLKKLYRRYVDIGCFYATESWIEAEFGKNTSEGIRFILSEWKYLFRHKAWYLIPYSVIRNAVKWFAYRIGARRCRRSK